MWTVFIRSAGSTPSRWLCDAGNAGDVCDAGDVGDVGDSGDSGDVGMAPRAVSRP